MSVPKGFGNIIGLKKESTYGTAVACAASSGLYYREESLTPNAAYLRDDSIGGKRSELVGAKGNELWAGDVTMLANYDGLETLIALAFGTAGTPTSLTNRTGSDGVAVSGDATFTSATAAFATGDVGKTIVLVGAGPAAADLTTTISSRTSATEIELAVTAGTSVNPCTWTIKDPAYVHTFKPKDDLEGLFCTLAQWIQHIPEVREYASCKVNSIEFTFKQGEFPTVTVNFIPQKMTVNTSSGTNTNNTAATITCASTRNLVKFEHLALLMNAQSGAGLSSPTDAIYVSEIRIKIDNKLETDVTSKFGYLTDEPQTSGLIDVTVAMNFSKYQTNNQALTVAALSKAVQKATVTLTGPIAVAAQSYAWKFWFPSLTISSNGYPSTKGAGKMAFDAVFTAARVASIPTGFTAGYTDPVTMDLTSLRITDALA